MAKASYIGVDNLAKKFKKAYFSPSGVAKKVKKIYIGINDVAELCYEANDGIAISSLPKLTLIKINKSGVATDFLILKHNYTSGRTLILQNECNSVVKYGSGGDKSGFWQNSSLRTWLNSTYLNYFSSFVKELISTTTYKVVDTTKTLVSYSSAIFCLSAKELGSSNANWSSSEGSSLGLSTANKKAYYQGNLVRWWTRSATIASGYSANASACAVTTSGSLSDVNTSTTTYNRPCFTLPGTALVMPTQNADGSYTLIEQ